MALFYTPEGDKPYVFNAGDGKYGFSYQELRDDYRRFTMMSDEEWLDSLLDILHFSVYVCYVKEMQTRYVLADDGIIHELVHLLLEERLRKMRADDYRVTDAPLEKIRDLFNRDCCLA